MSASVAADAEPAEKSPARSGTVQSIERAFGLLETMADHGGTMGLSQLAAESGLPLPTIHRLLRTLVDLGYLRQDPSRQYVLAPRLIRLGESSGAMLSVWAKPAPRPAGRRARRVGQPGHARRRRDRLRRAGAVPALDADVHRGRPSRAAPLHGRRQGDHGPDAGGPGARPVAAHRHAASTPRHTITDPDAFAKALLWVGEHGYAIDDEEQEHGVRCVAVAVPDAPTKLGLSVSGPATRMTPEVIERTYPILRDAAAALSRDLS